MASQAKLVYRHEMRLFKDSYSIRQWDVAVYHLERAHIVAQRYLWAHMVTHIWMTRVAIHRQDLREFAGQLTRMMAVLPAHLLGWVPVGNTGGANVSPIKPMPIPQDLRSSFIGYSLKRQIAWRIAIYSSLLLAGWALLPPTAELDSAGSDTQLPGGPVKVADLGSTATLEILPLVNWHTSDKRLKTEAGVSYLIKTDKNTVLFDTGWNEKKEQPSPLQHNMKVLGVPEAAIDSIFISHAHHDHVGGNEWEKGASFSLGQAQGDLSSKRIFAPIPLSYPGVTVQTISAAGPLLPGIASTGPIMRKLVLGRIDEQAMVINVAGKGLVLIVGCGHQTVAKLIAKVKRDFNTPLYGIVGDLHYPVPSGRRYLLGVNLQRMFASGTGLTNPIGMEQIQDDMALLERENIQLLGIGGHDTSDEVIAMFSKRFGPRYRHVEVGTKIRL